MWVLFWYLYFPESLLDSRISQCIVVVSLVQVQLFLQNLWHVVEDLILKGFVFNNFPLKCEQSLYHTSIETR